MIHAFLFLFPLPTLPGKDYSPRNWHPALSCTSLEEGEWTDPRCPPQTLTARLQHALDPGPHGEQPRNMAPPGSYRWLIVQFFLHLKSSMYDFYYSKIYFKSFTTPLRISAAPACVRGRSCHPGGDTDHSFQAVRPNATEAPPAPA